MEDTLFIFGACLYFTMLLAVLAVSIFFIYIFIVSGGMKNPPLIFSSKKSKEIIVDEVAHYKKDKNQALTIVDAGCGTGTLLVPLAKEFPDASFIGIEWSLIPYLISKFRSRKINNLKIIKMDMFKFDFSNVDIVICFLITSIMPRFTKKMLAELKKGSQVFSSRFELEKIKASKIIGEKGKFDTIYLYDF